MDLKDGVVLKLHYVIQPIFMIFKSVITLCALLCRKMYSLSQIEELDQPWSKTGPSESDNFFLLFLSRSPTLSRGQRTMKRI